MNIALIEIKGSDECVSRFLSSINLKITSQWKKGDPFGKSHIHQQAGLKAEICDVDSPQEMIGCIRDYFAECENRNICFTDTEIDAVLDIGVGVGDGEQFIVFVEFTNRDLSLMSKLGLGLSITAYPVEDDS